MSEPIRHREAGNMLTQLRQSRNWKFREVHDLTKQISERHGRSDFTICPSRLKGLEAGELPSIHKLYSLAIVYEVNPELLFTWYNIPLNIAADQQLARDFKKDKAIYSRHRAMY